MRVGWGGVAKKKGEGVMLDRVKEDEMRGGGGGVAGYDNYYEGWDMPERGYRR